MKDLKKLSFIQEFIEAFIDYHEGDPTTIEGEPTDAELLKEALPELKRLIQGPQSVNDVKDEPWFKEFITQQRKEASRETELIDIEVALEELQEKQWFKNYVYTQVKDAKESVDPHVKYMVVDTELQDEAGITDDYKKAFEVAMQGSRDGRNMYLLRVCKADDGSWRTYVDEYFSDGEWIEGVGKGHEYLHFNYIEEAVGVRKI